MGATLSPSGLKTNDAGEDFLTDENANITLLNNTLLKLSALADVDVTGISDDDVLQYNSGTTKWEPVAPSGIYTEPMTTTTTSTTSTTSTSTTTTSSTTTTTTAA